MRILFAITFSTFLLLSFGYFQNVSSQTESENYADEEKRWLRSDLKSAHVSAFVNVTQFSVADSIGGGNCETNVGGGYCLYLLKAEIKESFKGKSETKSLEFYTSAETEYPKKHLLGEKIVFLVRGENGRLSSIENSSRGTEILATMRKIADLKTPVDDADDTDPYSFKALQNDFAIADAVIFADVKSFREDKERSSFQEFILQAEVVEVLKGSFKTGEKIEYLDDLSYRSFNQNDLGKQIIFLEKQEEGGKVFYSRIKYTADFVRNDILEKLRKIAAKK
jgi:hypothetical protein